MPMDDFTLNQSTRNGNAFPGSVVAGIPVVADDRTVLALRLVSNSKENATNVLATLAAEMKTCDRFDIAVAFVANSGITTLIQSLLELQERGVRGRILTSTYLGFNEPDALERFSRFPNIELRVFEGSLHTKGYFFNDGEMRTLIIGSSNLTQTALTTNQEWNLLVKAYHDGTIANSTQLEFERLWNATESSPVDESWLASYRESFRRRPIPTTYRTSLNAASDRPDQQQQGAQLPIIVPNKMQKHALERLATLRADGARRALLVSATGTGKTYLAAFDVARAQAKRLLFVVHREHIASSALESFRAVCGPDHTYGIFSGNRHEADADYVFCTVQLLARNLDRFDPDAFDYLIIDEAHRAGAESYRRVIDHFRPRFMLGMTATPDRTDGVNVYDLFDNNIAHRITLQEAQESNMLAPFHYFGITDLHIDDRTIDDPSLFSQLVSEERADHIARAIRDYSVESDRRGLMFCSKVAEARELARMLNDRGVRALALDGSTSPEARAAAIERLECDRSTRDDWLEYLLTVDIFNEGVDIPCINQIIMLRPTESATVFVQQLGRGLRLHPGKDYVLVLDFIGNYQKNFLIPIALSGDRSYNKDNLRRYLREGNRLIPGCSTISFDEIAERRIYRALDAERFGTVGLIRQEYASLRNMLGRIPSLMDFYENGSIDPQLIFNNPSLGSYHVFLSKYEHERYRTKFTPVQESMLMFVSRKLAAGKRPHELLLLQALMNQNPVSEQEFTQLILRESARTPVAACSVARVLAQDFQTGAARETYAQATFLRFDGTTFEPTPEFVEALKDPEFRRQLAEVVELGLMKYHAQFSSCYENTSLVLYQKYTYEDVCRLLEWGSNVSGQNIGGYKYDADTNTFPVFINYDKSSDIAASINYHDRFLSPDHLIAISKQPRHLSSPEIVRLQHVQENGMRIYLFVRKNKDDQESKEFYFLGRMHPTGNFKPITMAGTDKPAVEIEYELETPVHEELYDYLTSPSVD